MPPKRRKALLRAICMRRFGMAPPEMAKAAKRRKGAPRGETLGVVWRGPPPPRGTHAVLSLTYPPTPPPPPPRTTRPPMQTGSRRRSGAAARTRRAMTKT